MKANPIALNRYEKAAKTFCQAEGLKPDENIENHCAVFLQLNFVGPRWQHVAMQMHVNAQLSACGGWS